MHSPPCSFCPSPSLPSSLPPLPFLFSPTPPSSPFTLHTHTYNKNSTLVSLRLTDLLSVSLPPSLPLSLPPSLPPSLYFRYLSKNSLWNFPSRSITPSIFSSGGRNVVRKCHVPSTCDQKKREGGTKGGKEGGKGVGITQYQILRCTQVLVFGLYLPVRTPSPAPPQSPSPHTTEYNTAYPASSPSLPPSLPPS